jgi:hypothetical protein
MLHVASGEDMQNSSDQQAKKNRNGYADSNQDEDLMTSSKKSPIEPGG